MSVRDLRATAVHGLCACCRCATHVICHVQHIMYCSYLSLISITAVPVLPVDRDAFNNQHIYSTGTLHRGQSALCCKHRAKHSGWNA